jgi:surfeit locus 1 family protein
MTSNSNKTMSILKNNIRCSSFKSILWYLLTMSIGGFLLALGVWQLSRYQAASVRQNQFESQQEVSPLTHLVSAANEGEWFSFVGELLLDKSLLLDNQTHQGRVGYRWLVPFLVQTTNLSVLVDLGFIAYQERSQLPNLPQIPRYQELIGQLYVVRRNPFNDQLHAETGYPKRIQALELKPVAQLLSLSIADYVLRVKSIQGMRIQSNWKPLSMPPQKHLGYAVQWFCMSIVFVTMMCWAKKRHQLKG